MKSFFFRPLIYIFQKENETNISVSSENIGKRRGIIWNYQIMLIQEDLPRSTT